MNKRDDPFAGRDWKKFETSIRRDMIPQMKGSSTVLLIAPDIGADFDVRFAVQIGATVLLEKPLLVILPKGRTPPPKLERIADRIIHADPGDAHVQDEIKRFMADFGKQ